MPVLQQVVAIRKVAEPRGWMGNMPPHPLTYGGVEWRTAEALFQALRFEPGPLREQIRAKSSPMQAKWLAKGHRAEMVVQPLSEEDLLNMRRVLRLKVRLHAWMVRELLDSGDALIVEDCGNRRGRSGRFWGAALEGGEWVGRNMLGTMWMELRQELREQRGEQGGGA